MKEEIESTKNLRDEVKAFVISVMQDEPERVTAASITTAFIDSKRGIWPPLPTDLNAAAYIGIGQCVRPNLRDLLDTVAAAVGEGQIPLPDLPEEYYLQAYYSVGTQGNESIYVKRTALTVEEKDALVERDRRLAAHFQRRADALEAWWHRTHQDEEC